MKIRKFVVGVREVYVQPIEVEAEDYKDAVKKIEDGQGKFLEDELTYSHTLENEYWTDETGD